MTVGRSRGRGPRRRAEAASFATVLLAVAAALAVTAARPARACVYADEASELVGWSRDGRHALFVQPGPDGRLLHAEIHPTVPESGPLRFIERRDGMIEVREAANDGGPGPDFPQGPAVESVEAERFTREALERLEAVRELEIGREGEATGLDPATIRARVEMRRWWAEFVVHLETGDGERIASFTPPVWCVGSCIRDGHWEQWKVEVVGSRRIADLVQFELRIAGACNGGTEPGFVMTRVVAVPSRTVQGLAAATAAGEAPCGPGRVSVISRPVTVVFIDGERINFTPVVNWPLEPGPHEVRLVEEDLGIDDAIPVRAEPGRTLLIRRVYDDE